MSTTAIVTGCGADSGKRSGLMVGLLLLGLASSGIAGDQARTLPRGFQKAQLGMALGELMRLKPDLAKSRRLNLATESLSTTPTDPYLQRIVYRLHTGTGDLHRRRTVWQDAQTRITLLEREYFHDGNKALELTLTLTDLELVRLRDLAQDEQVQRKMQEIPIPLSDMELSPGRGARAGVDG
ncbi:MAG: hypothetical protein AUG95_00150 [Nitrospirae bacterium 13_1_20CM_4_62_6]|nr:MAG: hypothetical protein AUG95_00150 [Nitrospirae bacterium 13_1_20CM_4_62_6]